MTTQNDVTQEGAFYVPLQCTKMNKNESETSQWIWLFSQEKLTSFHTQLPYNFKTADKTILKNETHFYKHLPYA